LVQEAQDNRPRYQQIADALRAEIESGVYDETGKLPSEKQLTERFEAARGTVRDALQVLHAEDRTEARRGSGVYLRTFRRIERDAVERLSRRHWAAGRSIWDSDLKGRSRQEAITVREVEAPDHVAGVLGVPAGEKVWLRSRLYYSEKRPVQQSTSWYPADLARGTAITQVDTGPGGAYACLDRIGHGPARFREEIRVRLPLSQEVESLGITMSTPVVIIVRTAYDSGDRPVEVNEMVLDSYSLIYRFAS
jgi:GntR family transcriptional regulator